MLKFLHDDDDDDDNDYDDDLAIIIARLFLRNRRAKNDNQGHITQSKII